MKIIDKFLNSIGMYRLVIYGLSFISFVLILFGFLNIIPYRGFDLIISLIFIMTVCEVLNQIVARIVGAYRGTDSTYITSLILFLILSPFEKLPDFLPIFIACFVAIMSKYILAYHKKHIFNPAAFAAFFVSITSIWPATWWSSNSSSILFLIIVGLLIVKKIKRFSLFLTFFVISYIMILFFYLNSGAELTQAIGDILLSWPIVFLGTIMLTEPSTTPPTVKYQVLYGAIVAVFMGIQFRFGRLHSTPQLALLIGNLFSYYVSPKIKVILELDQIKNIGKNIYEFVFDVKERFGFLPGQYMEWTLLHNHEDSRGNRRYFTIASSPTESKIYLGVKIPEKPSSFKKRLLGLKKGDKMSVSQLSGEFVIESNQNIPLVFIAGGIGITPFRSMVSYIIDKKQNRDVIVFYACSDDEEFVYKDVFKNAEKYGVKTYFINTRKDGFIDENLIKNKVSNYINRIYYLSGPNAMVDNYKKVIKDLGVKSKNIRSDYFPGY